MKFRTELDALNAIHQEMRKINELLTTLLNGNITAEKVEPIIDKAKRPYTRRAKNDAS